MSLKRGLEPGVSPPFLYFFYKVLQWLIYPPLLLGLFIVRLRRPKKALHLLKRLGLYRDSSLPAERSPKIWPLFWIHALSFGEVRASKPLIEEIRRRWPKAIIVGSSSTVTGLDELRKRCGHFIDHTFAMPFDFSPCFHRVKNCLSPCCLIVVETDVWPNLFWTMKRGGSRLILVNGSISKRAKKRLSLFRGLAQLLYGPFDLLLMQSEKDKMRLLEIGLGPRNLYSIGNLKLDNVPCTDRTALLSALKGVLEIIANSGRVNVVFGSIHQGEEQVINYCHEKLREAGLSDEVTFIVAPRYPEVSRRLAETFKGAGMSVCLRSELEKEQETKDTSGPDCIVVDTLGELQSFYAIGDIAVMGGTFVPVGGHNVLEPANLGVPVLVGPYIESIEDLCHELQRGGGLLRVESREELSEALIELIRSPEERARMGQDALSCVKSLRGVAKRCVDLIEEVVSE